MYDFHYDLLTKIYIDYLNHDLSDITFFCYQNYNKNNILGLIANLCFMSDEEMKEEYHEDYYKDGNLINMFEISTKIARKIVPGIDMIFSIEGCDKLENIADLDKLYDLGLRAIVPVWNEKNQFGSGVRSEEGLTKSGKELIKKAIDLGIAIDLSHANKKTFNDIIDLVKEEQQEEKETIVYASHSNCSSICNRIRNLTDKQIAKLRDINAYIGLFSNTRFIDLDHSKINNTPDNYVKHIKQVEKIYGNTDYIVLSTDDMKWCEKADPIYGQIQLFPYHKLQEEMRCLLSKYYSNNDVEKIMYKNGQKVFTKIKQQELNKNYEKKLK